MVPKFFENLRRIGCTWDFDMLSKSKFLTKTDSPYSDYQIQFQRQKTGPASDRPSLEIKQEAAKTSIQHRFQSSGNQSGAH